MAMTVVTSGTKTPGSNAEADLESARAPGAATTYVFEIDCGAMVSPEVTFIRVYVVVLASGTERVAYAGSYYAGSDADPIQFTVPVPVDTGTGITIRCTIQQKNGTLRAYPWKLYSL